jgi:hypothetical protein
MASNRADSSCQLLSWHEPFVLRSFPKRKKTHPLMITSNLRTLRKKSNRYVHVYYIVLGVWHDPDQTHDFGLWGELHWLCHRCGCINISKNPVTLSKSRINAWIAHKFRILHKTFVICEFHPFSWRGTSADDRWVSALRDSRFRNSSKLSFA